ncbi:MAG TPA: hypothetical protein VGX68_18470 [Thermoanaerobaculia bacterium]|jgi:hypothetical protein|nr:hypothetical protein [Thermoanaerobaculia bacterium]
MTSTLPLETIVHRLEAQIAFDREQEAFHAEREAFHREQRAVHAAEMEKLASILEAVKSASAIAVDLGNRAALPHPPPSLEIGRKPSPAKMVKRIVETRKPGDVVGTSAVLAEINRHYRSRLRRPVKPHLIALTLRRMCDRGELREVRKGRPHHEALYAKV